MILAAGGSRRFGTGRENKLLFSFPADGTPVIVRICQRIVEAGFQPVVAVVGFQGWRVRKALHALPVRVVRNRRWKEGMSGSIRTGVEAIRNRCDGAAVILGDMPLLTVETLTHLRNRFESSKGKHIVFPTFRGNQGNPVIFPRTFFPEIMAVAGDRGCKGVLEDHREDSEVTPVPSDEVLLDYDTVSDYWEIMCQVSRNKDEVARITHNS